MANIIFSFKALHKALGGIETEVSVYDDRISLKRKISGVLALTVKLPSETTVFYNDLSAINLVEPSGINGIGWIELSGISINGGTMKTVDVNGKVLNNVDTVNALGNPYCIVFNKDKNEMKDYFNKLRDAYQEYKSKEKNSSTTIINQNQEESSLDKIKKLKDLLDIGAISQEEFDEKKKTLMNNI